MESKNDLTARVHEWLTRFGLCPEVPDEDGWMYVNYCGIPSDCKLYDDKVMFALDFAIQSDDFDFEACAEAALDLMEEFRPLIADSVVVSLINRNEISPADFLEASTGCGLLRSGHQAF